MSNYVTYSATDIGTVREKNQDTIGVLINTHPDVDAALGVVCDGVGGLKEGEYASATTYAKFVEWFQYEFCQLIWEEDFEELLRNRWIKLVENHNRYLFEYALGNNTKLGTTLTAILLFRNRYYTIQVGDSRAYEITDRLEQLTEDQSLVAREVREGILTKEQAKYDPRQNILLQSIGYSKNIVPDFKCGDMRAGASYIICSDGFYHHVSDEEFTGYLHQPNEYDTSKTKLRVDSMIDAVKQRGERDNISVALLKYQA